MGEILYEKDCKEAGQAKKMFKNNKLEFKNDQERTLFLMMYVATINTREKDENNSTWRENTLAIAGNSLTR